MKTRMNRRSLVQRASALGAGAALVGPLSARAQATPEAAAGMETAPAAEAVIQEFREMGGSLRMLSAVVGGKNPEEDELWAQEFTRLTGIELELVHPTADYEEKLLADLAAGVEYDLIYMNKNRMDVLVADEILTDLTEQVQNSELLQDPSVIPSEEWDMIRYEGDRFYSVFNKFEGARMLTTRQDWLDALGMEHPRTLDEVYQTMVAFRDENPGGTDEPPLGLSTAGTYDIQPFMSSEGVYPGYVMVDGARTIPYASEAAIPVYQWLQDLYAEGLYDPNFATATTADMRDLFFADQVGFVTYWDTWVGLFNNTAQANNPGTEFQAVGIAATEGPEGIIITRGQPSVWTIPVNAPNPELAFKFMEWWHTTPGIMLGSLGIEDHDYTVSDGSYALTEVGEEHSMDHGVPTPYSDYWQNPIGTLPGIEDAQAISIEHGYLEQLGPDWTPDVQPILDETIIQIILGDLSPEDGVASMREQLLNQDLIDD